MCIYAYMRMYEYIRLYTLVQTGLQPMCFNLRFDMLQYAISKLRNCVLPPYPSSAYCTVHSTVSLREAFGSRLYSRLLVTVQYKLMSALTGVFRLLFLPMYRTVPSVIFPCCCHTGCVSYSYLSANLQVVQFSYLLKPSKPDYRHFRRTVHQ
jgi:hypothetical protein